VAHYYHSNQGDQTNQA